MVMLLVTHLAVSINISTKCKPNLLLQFASKIGINVNPIHIKINVKVTWKVDTTQGKPSQGKSN